MAKKELTEKEQLFLKYLVSEECNGNPVKAKELAGYSDGTSAYSLIKRLREEILESAETVLAAHAIEAAFGLAGAVRDAREPDIKERMTAMKELLDRAGVIKKDGSQQNDGSVTTVFILPPKQQNDE